MRKCVVPLLALFLSAPALAQEDPFAPVYVVTSRATYEGSLRQVADDAALRHDSAGRQVVIARTQSHRLEDLTRLVHEHERRCGGYFAFPTLAEAEAFLRNDRTVQAMQAQALVEYTVDQPELVAGWFAQVEEPRIRETIRQLSTDWNNRYYLSNHGRDSAEWIRDTWLALGQGRADVSAELFTDCSNCGIQPSVILTVQGAELPDEVVVLGGHLDSISSTGWGDDMIAPGADDDASGIAVLTEIIRIALADGWRPKRTIKFMGYAAEEVGLRGSYAISRAFRNSGVNVVGVLQLDMTNYNAGSTLAMRLVTDYSSNTMKTFVGRLFSTYLAPDNLDIGTTSCGYACSDHASWTSAGYPSAFVIEPVLFPTRHTPTDTLENVGPTADISVPFAKLGLAFVAELGKTAADDEPVTQPAIHDFNGDGKSDLLWRHTVDGRNTLWRSARSSHRTPVARVQDPEWRIVAIGDFDGDGEDDLFWRHRTSGANTVWLSARSARRLPTRDVTDTDWEVAGAGDVDGDGRDDVVWRQRGTGANTIWRAANADDPIAMEDDDNLDWEIAGIGDFDGDGLSDVYWRHRGNGQLRYWPAGDATRAIATTTEPHYPAVPIDFGDLDGDGRTDMIKRVDEVFTVWPSGHAAGAYTLPTVQDPETVLEATGDYDGDGRADLFFHNDRTGFSTIWLGGRAGYRQPVPRVADPAWDVQPTRITQLPEAFP